MTEIREYRTDDERSWLMCRLLGFFDTAYFDDVKTARTTFENTSIELVATVGDEVVAVCDVEIFGELATIDTIAVHPDHQRAGVGTRLLDATLERLPDGVSVLDAWTRDDDAANRWYQRNGFVQDVRYLHVYAGGQTFQDAGGLVPAIVFAHGSAEDEERMRAEHERVYVCRQYVRKLC